MIFYRVLDVVYGDREYWAREYGVSPATIRARCRSLLVDPTTGRAMYRQYEVAEAMKGCEPRPDAREATRRRKRR